MHVISPLRKLMYLFNHLIVIHAGCIPIKINWWNLNFQVLITIYLSTRQLIRIVQQISSYFLPDLQIETTFVKVIVTWFMKRDHFKTSQKCFVYIHLPWIVVHIYSNSIYTKVFLRCFNSGPFSQIRSQMSGSLLQIRSHISSSV